MPVHFAAARCASRSPVARALARKALRRAANDNPGGSADNGGQARVLSAALRHFAEHGLRAATEAAMQAEQAWRAGDNATCRWWTDICETLDRGMARQLSDRLRAQDNA